MTEYRRTYRHALSPSEAIDRIFEYEPQESSLSEVLDLTVEQADRDYRVALADAQREAEVADLKQELELAEAERDLARDMHIELNTVGDKLLAGGKHDYLILSQREYYGLQPHFTKESLYYWAKQCHGKVIPDWAPVSASNTAQTETSRQSTDKTTPDRDWTSVSIRLLPDNCISYSLRGGNWEVKPLIQTMFVDKRKKGAVTPNKSFEILANLAAIAATAKFAGHPNAVGFGAGLKVAKGSDKARKDKLCRALADLVGLQGNPFSERSPSDGYQPHFTVEDKRHETMRKDERTTVPLEHDPEDRRYGTTQHPNWNTFDDEADEGHGEYDDDDYREGGDDPYDM